MRNLHKHLLRNRNLKETEEGMTSALSMDAFDSGVSIESVRIESRPCYTPWSKKELSPHPGSNKKGVNVVTLPVKLG